MNIYIYIYILYMHIYIYIYIYIHRCRHIYIHTGLCHTCACFVQSHVYSSITYIHQCCPSAKCSSTNDTRSKFKFKSFFQRPRNDDRSTQMGETKLLAEARLLEHCSVETRPQRTNTYVYIYHFAGIHGRYVTS
jgi:hypothetical protein